MNSSLLFCLLLVGACQALLLDPQVTEIGGDSLQGFSSRLGLFSSKRRHPILDAPLPDHGPPAYEKHHHHHPRRPRPKVPHYVKYWEQNQHHPHQKKKKGWKMVKQSPFAPGYFADLAGRLADGVGLLPEYGHQDHKHGAHKHGKYDFKGITIHNGFFTKVI